MHSLSKAIVRSPCARFAAGLTSVDMGAPNHALALQQHAAYCEALEQCGLTLTQLEADERFPDSTFVEDTAVIVGGHANDRASDIEATQALPDIRPTAPESAMSCAVLTRPGASSRAGEVESVAAVLSQFFPELPVIQEPGTVDGGDICEADDHFFIGVSARTNEAGALQLASLVNSYGYTSSLIDIRDVKNILHLKSGLASLGDHRLVVIDALADHNEFHNHELVRVNASEQYAANCVRVNDHVLVAAGYPEFERTLQELDYQTISLEMTEFQKMAGGLSCLSLRF